MTQLHLVSNQIEKLNLNHLTNLSSLVLSENLLKDTKEFKHFPNLKTLKLNNNAIKILRRIKLPMLEHLSLDYNEIE